MSADVCSTVRSIPPSIWSKKPEPIPEWMLRLLDDVIVYAGVPAEFAPRLAVTSMPCDSHFAGRWFYQVNGVAIALQPSLPIIKGVELHELGHWLSWIRNGDEAGEHDDHFYAIMRDLYPAFKVSLETARTIDHHSKDKVSWR
jgi:hypothetical protein